MTWLESTMPEYGGGAGVRIKGSGLKMCPVVLDHVLRDPACQGSEFLKMVRRLR